MNILFVCTANINRSFMAERILRGQLKKHAKYNINVSSAALLDMKAAAADPVTAELLVANGYDGSGHKSSLLTESKVDWADLILVMEGSQRRLILDQFPKAEGRSTFSIHILRIIRSRIGISKILTGCPLTIIDYVSLRSIWLFKGC